MKLLLKSNDSFEKPVTFCERSKAISRSGPFKGDCFASSQREAGIFVVLQSYLKKYLILLASILFLAAGCSKSENKENDTGQQGRTIEYSKEVTFLNSKGQEITTIQAAVADDASERNMGLMDVNELPTERGMLFIFETQQPLSFWMINTPLSLDIFFVNESMEIVRIYQNTQPFSEKNLTSEKPARYVIETNGGFSLSHDIQEGMKVEFETETISN